MLPHSCFNALFYCEMEVRDRRWRENEAIEEEAKEN
jgi:hypothetical protein